MIIPPYTPDCPHCDAVTFWGVCKQCATPAEMRTVAAHFASIANDPTESLKDQFEAGNRGFSWAREAYYREQENAAAAEKAPTHSR